MSHSYEMLHGMTPFWAENHSDMYRRVLYDDLRFPHFDRPEDMLDQPTRSFLRGVRAALLAYRSAHVDDPYSCFRKTRRYV